MTAVTVKKARQAAGLTQVRLAVNAGISPATVHRIEAGRHVPTESTVVAIARALGVPAESIAWPEADTPHRACGTNQPRPAPASVDGSGPSRGA